MKRLVLSALCLGMMVAGVGCDEDDPTMEEFAWDNAGVRAEKICSLLEACDSLQEFGYSTVSNCKVLMERGIKQYPGCTTETTALYLCKYGNTCDLFVQSLKTPEATCPLQSEVLVNCATFRAEERTY